MLTETWREKNKVSHTKDKKCIQKSDPSQVTGVCQKVDCHAPRRRLPSLPPQLSSRTKEQTILLHYDAVHGYNCESTAARLQCVAWESRSRVAVVISAMLFCISTMYVLVLLQCASALPCLWPRSNRNCGGERRTAYKGAANEWKMFLNIFYKISARYNSGAVLPR